MNDPTGQTGSIAADPLFCDLSNRDLGLLEMSPCAPYTPPNVECHLIGALPVGCTTIPNRRPAIPNGIALTATPTIFAPGAASVRLAWQLPPGIGEDEIALHIIDANVRTVRHLPTASATWDGLDERGQPVSSGIFYGQLRAAGRNVTKMLLCVR